MSLFVVRIYLFDRQEIGKYGQLLIFFQILMLNSIIASQAKKCGIKTSDKNDGPLWTLFRILIKVKF